MMKAVEYLIVATIFLASLFGSTAKADDLINSLLRVDGNYYPLPWQINEVKRLVFYFGAEKAINSFPYGNGQIDYIKGKGIKRVYLSAYASTPNGGINPHRLMFTLSIEFDTRGRVIKGTRFFNSGGKEHYVHNEVKYDGLTMSEIDTKKYRYRFDKNTRKFTTPYRNLDLDENNQVIYSAYRYSDGRADLNVRFIIDTDGRVLRIVDQVGAPNSNGLQPLIAEYEVFYEGGKYPTHSVRNWVRGGNPNYTNFNPAAFAFDLDDKTFSQSRDLKKWGTGSVYDTHRISYTTKGEQIASLSVSLSESPNIYQPPFVAYYDDQELRGFLGKHGFNLQNSNGLLKWMTLHLSGFVNDLFLPDGDYEFKYRLNGEISRIIYKRGHIIKIDHDQTEFHEL